MSGCPETSKNYWTASKPYNIVALNKLFETPRLIVREFEVSDFEQVHLYAQSGEVLQYQNWGPNTEEDTLNFIKNSIDQINKSPRLVYEFGIVLKETGNLIGGCGMFLKAENLKEASIGYIVNPDYWRNGYATEATSGLLEYAKNKMGLEQIKATCDTRNIASQRVLEKNGFRLERVIKNDFEQKGQMRDTYLFYFRG